MAKKVLSLLCFGLVFAFMVGCTSEPSAGDNKETANKFDKMNKDLPEGSISR